MATNERSLPLDHGRRNFLNWFLGTSAGAFLVAVLYPLSRYLIPPEVEESTAHTVTLSIKPQELKANTGQIFRFGSQPAILVDTPAGVVKAFSATCHPDKSDHYTQGVCRDCHPFRPAAKSS